MASRATYYDVLNSPPTCPHVANDQNNRLNDGVTIKDGRHYTFGMNLGVQDQLINLQTRDKNVEGSNLVLDFFYLKVSQLLL